MWKEYFKLRRQHLKRRKFWFGVELFYLLNQLFLTSELFSQPHWQLIYSMCYFLIKWRQRLQNNANHLMTQMWMLGCRGFNITQASLFCTKLNTAGWMCACTLTCILNGDDTAVEKVNPPQSEVHNRAKEIKSEGCLVIASHVGDLRPTAHADKKCVQSFYISLQTGSILLSFTNPCKSTSLLTQIYSYFHAWY